MDADPDALTITTRYRLSGDAPELEFAETFALALGEPLTPARRAAFERVGRLLWLAAGLSYYKTAAPGTVGVPAPSAAEREWLEALYRGGLGEFAAVNGIDLSTRPLFREAEGRVPGPAEGLGLGRRSLVAVGGGKDSCVSLEVLRDAGEDVVAFSVGGYRAARDCVEAAGLPLVVARRTLDPKLVELNRAGALNGHVPRTAIANLVAGAPAGVPRAREGGVFHQRPAGAP